MLLFSTYTFLIISVLRIVVGDPRSRPSRREEESWRRIIGGTLALIDEFPFLVSVCKAEEHYCGASVLAERWVLSGAHCTYYPETNIPVPLDHLTIVFGITNIRKPLAPNVLPAELVIRHPRYNYVSLEYDIGLIKVTRSFPLGHAVQKVPLPAPGTPLSVRVGDTCTVMGWGFTDPKQELQDYRPRLFKVNVSIVDTRHCQQLYEDDTVDAGYHLCAGWHQGGKDACQGDSGGPLLCAGVQVAVTSWGEDCGQAHHPGVYVRTDFFLGWIHNHLDPLSRSRALSLQPYIFTSLAAFILCYVL